MRTDSANFTVQNLSSAKSPRYVIELSFDPENTILRYFTSHADAATPIGAQVIYSVVQGISGTSQKLNPDTANASIGAINFNLVDKASAITVALGGQLILGRSTRRQRVRIYVGFEGLAWADYTLVQTQLVTKIDFEGGAYKFSCADVQREMRKELFELAKTSLAAAVASGDTTIQVNNTAAFSMVSHGLSYSDSSLATVGYIKINDEVIKYTGKTSTQFTGCTRGALNTVAADHTVDLGASVDRRTKVEEYVYLEEPGVKLAHMLLVGAAPPVPDSETVSKDYNSSKWVAGQTPNQYFPNEDVAGESFWAVRKGPGGYDEVVNCCQSLDTAAGDPGADGGWGMNNAIPVNIAKSHLFFCWFKRLSTGNPQGSAYWGPAHSQVNDLVGINGGAVNGNPYFITGGQGFFMPDADQWYLAVGFVHANGYGGSSANISGMYDPRTGSRFTSSMGINEFRWANGVTAVGHRAYQYYNTTISGETQQMARPTIVECTVAQATAMVDAILSQGRPLPANWHLGIDALYVRFGDFGNKADLYDWRDDRLGFITRFDGLEKTDGKQFIESEINLLTGTFMPVYADGALGLKRMANILAGAPYVQLLDDTNVVQAQRVEHDFEALRNVVQIDWNWEVGRDDFTRINLLVDANSITNHGRAEPLKLEFRGLHGSRHTSSMLAQRFDAIRDRYTNPPLKTNVRVMPHLNTLEVGDVVRLKPKTLRDFVSGGDLDRSFEIQNTSINWVTGDVNLELFGSSQAPGAISPTSNSLALSDAWYTSQGTNLTSVLTINGSGQVTAGGTVTGNADGSLAIYYYNGDLTINAGVTVNITQNVQIRVKGFFQNNGTINGVGAGIAGAPAYSSPSQWYHFNAGTPGFIGTPIAGGGLIYHPGPGTDKLNITSTEGHKVIGANSAVPGFNLTWDGTTLSGLPRDLRGSSGSSGMPAYRVHTSFPVLGTLSEAYTAGGAGGAGGAGLVIVSRGFAQGAAGKIDLSGGNGSAGGTIVTSGDWFDLNQKAGSGAGGAPGGLLIVLDGALSTGTGLTENGFVAKYGTTPITGTPMPSPSQRPFVEGQTVYSYFVGNGDGTTFGLPNYSGGRGGSRFQYAPATETAGTDPAFTVLTPPTNLGLQSLQSDLLINADGTVISRIRVTWTPSNDSRVLAYDIQAKPSSESIWGSFPTVFGQASNITLIPVPKAGVNWDVRIRSSGANRLVSEWLTVTGFPVTAKDGPPSNVGTLSFTDSILQWNDIIDLDRRGYIVKYNQGSNTDWNAGTLAHSQGFITESEFHTDHIVGGQVTLMVKAIDTTGNVSVSASTLVVDLRPVQPDSFTITRQPDGTREFAWLTFTPPTDFAGTRLRYFLGSTSDWNAMTPLHVGLLTASPFETNQLASGTYTFAAKNVDQAGNESANAIFITSVPIGDPRITGALEDLREEPIWSGTKTGCTVDTVTGWLVANNTGSWSTIPGTWAGWVSWVDDATSPITYERLIDVGVKTKFTPLVTVIGDGSQTIQEQHSDDNVNYSSYASIGPQIDARYIRIKVTMSGTLPIIKSMRTILSAQTIEEIIEDLATSSLGGSYDLGVGNVRLPITKVYSVIKKVDVTLQSVGAGWSWELIDKNTSVGPQIKIYNSSNTLADATIDATIIGI